MRPKRVYIIAEAGVNHNGSLDMAKQLVEVAAQAGADAVKFQTFTADTLVNKNAPKADYQRQTTDTSESQWDMLNKLELSAQAHDVLIEHCKTKGIEFLSTPFDIPSVSLLANECNISCLKIASGEITNGPLLLKAAQTGKPVILSTGMSMLSDIEQALAVLAFGYLQGKGKPSLVAFQAAYSSDEGQQAIREKVTLLHCTTEYPAPYNEVNLDVMNTLQSCFGLPVGYSDHTSGIAIPVAAVARGATLIEKHFTLDRNLSGPDHQASLEPQELAEMITMIRQVEAAVGLALKRPTPSEIKNKVIARKSLVAAKPIKQGELFTEDNLTAKRPGTGISPLYYWDVLGTAAARDYTVDEVIQIW